MSPTQAHRRIRWGFLVLVSLSAVAIGVELARIDSSLSTMRRQACTNAHAVKAFLESDAGLKQRSGVTVRDQEAAGYWSLLAGGVVQRTCDRDFADHVPPVPADLRPKGAQP